SPIKRMLKTAYQRSMADVHQRSGLRWSFSTQRPDMRVLLVEDDVLIGQGIVAGLRKHGISVRHVDTAAAAEAAQLEDTFQALILDLGLPDLEGLELMARMRRFEPELPVLVLSARDAIEHRLAGLQSGADDYLVKPFDLRELAARLHALVRRTQGRAVQTIEAGPLRLEPDSGLAWLAGAPRAGLSGRRRRDRGAGSRTAVSPGGVASRSPCHAGRSICWFTWRPPMGAGYPPTRSMSACMASVRKSAAMRSACIFTISGE